MDIDATCLAMVDLTFDDCGVGTCLHLKARNAVVVDVIALEVALSTRSYDQSGNPLQLITTWEGSFRTCKLCGFSCHRARG